MGFIHFTMGNNVDLILWSATLQSQDQASSKPNTKVAAALTGDKKYLLELLCQH